MLWKQYNTFIIFQRIVGNPEENIAFYRDILNLKLIKNCEF